MFPFLLQGKFDTKLSQPGHFGQERFGAKFMRNYTYCPFSFVGPIYINKTATFGRKNKKKLAFLFFCLEMTPWATFGGKILSPFYEMGPLAHFFLHFTKNSKNTAFLGPLAVA